MPRRDSNLPVHPRRPWNFYNSERIDEANVPESAVTQHTGKYARVDMDEIITGDWEFRGQQLTLASEVLFDNPSKYPVGGVLINRDGALLGVAGANDGEVFVYREATGPGWEDIEKLPAHPGDAGYFLKTDGYTSMDWFVIADNLVEAISTPNDGGLELTGNGLGPEYTGRISASVRWTDGYSTYDLRYPRLDADAYITGKWTFADTMAIQFQGPANSTNTLRDSPDFRFEGHYYDGAASQTVAMRWNLDMQATTPAYRMVLRDNAGNERFWIDHLGAAAFIGGLVDFQTGIYSSTGDLQVEDSLDVAEELKLSDPTREDLSVLVLSGGAVTQRAGTDGQVLLWETAVGPTWRSKDFLPVHPGGADYILETTASGHQWVLASNALVKSVDSPNGGGLDISGTGAGPFSGIVSMSVLWSDGYADYDLRYSAIGHNHDDRYSQLGHTHALGDLSDVVIGTPQLDDVLMWDGSQWGPSGGLVTAVLSGSPEIVLDQNTGDVSISLTTDFRAKQHYWYQATGPTGSDGFLWVDSDTGILHFWNPSLNSGSGGWQGVGSTGVSSLSATAGGGIFIDGASGTNQTGPLTLTLDMQAISDAGYLKAADNATITGLWNFTGLTLGVGTTAPTHRLTVIDGNSGEETIVARFGTNGTGVGTKVGLQFVTNHTNAPSQAGRLWVTEAGTWELIGGAGSVPHLSVTAAGYVKVRRSATYEYPTLDVVAPIYPVLDFTSEAADASNRNWRIASVYNAYGRFQLIRSTGPNLVPTVATLQINNQGNLSVGPRSNVFYDGTNVQSISVDAELYPTFAMYTQGALRGIITSFASNAMRIETVAPGGPINLAPGGTDILRVETTGPRVLGGFHLKFDLGGAGIHNVPDGNYIYSNGSTQWHFRYGSGTSGSIALADASAVYRGYIYWSLAGFGLLSNSGYWFFRHDNGNSKTYIEAGVGGGGIQAAFSNQGLAVGSGGDLSPYGSSFYAVEVGDGASIMSTRGAYSSTWVVTNAYYTGTSWFTRTEGEATLYVQDRGTHVWYSDMGTSAGRSVSFVTHMVLFGASGNLMLGFGTDQGYKLAISGGIYSTGTSYHTGLQILSSRVSIGVTADQGYPLYVSGTSYLAGTAHVTGDILIGGASANGYRLNVAGSGYVSGDVIVGSTVQSTSYMQASTFYTTSSIDAKRDITPWDDLESLRLLRETEFFTYILRADSDEHQRVGFLAERVNRIFSPTGKNADIYSFAAVTASAVRATDRELRSLKDRVEELENAIRRLLNGN